MSDERKITLKLGEQAVDLRPLDTSDRCQQANVYFQEILLLTEWIERVRERFFFDNPSRKQRLEQVGFQVSAILLQSGCTEDKLPGALAAIGQVFDRLLPDSMSEFPEVPNAAVFERLARVSEHRRQALGKLLTELILDPALNTKENLDAIVNDTRDQAKMTAILDAVLG